MPSPKAGKSNTRLDQRTLTLNGVDFHFDNSNIRPLPPHVEIIRKAVIDLDCSLSARLDRGPDAAVRGNSLNKSLDGLGRRARQQIESRIEDYENVAKEAATLHSNNNAEPEWRMLYRSMFLEPLHDRQRLKEVDSSASRIKFYYDYFERREESAWRLFQPDGPFGERRKGLTYPKPDWAAYFPIYDYNPPIAVGFDNSSLWDWACYKKWDMVGDFDRNQLERLADIGLEYHVADVLRGKPDIDQAKMFSFPWLIVEHKKNQNAKNDIFCYCQAANAAACALLMFERLSRYAENERDQAHIPSVITMTTVGKDAKLWIGYATPGVPPQGAGPSLRGSARDAENVDEIYNWFHSRCIWAGDMTRITDVMDLDTLLENVHTWAMRVLRPQITQYLGQWRRHSEHLHTMPFPKLLAREKADILDYLRSGIGGVEERLRSLMVAYQEDTTERLEQLLSISFRGRKAQMLKDASSQTETAYPPQMQASPLSSTPILGDGKQIVKDKDLMAKDRTARDSTTTRSETNADLETSSEISEPPKTIQRSRSSVFSDEVAGMEEPRVRQLFTFTGNTSRMTTDSAFVSRSSGNAGLQVPKLARRLRTSSESAVTGAATTPASLRVPDLPVQSTAETTPSTDIRNDHSNQQETSGPAMKVTEPAKFNSAEHAPNRYDFSFASNKIWKDLPNSSQLDEK